MTLAPDDERPVIVAASDWWRQATVYQVYPRSFADADGDGLGDIAGVTSRIDYLAALGIDAIWLSPFYPSALADGGYDVADYRNVDPRLGTLDDFDALVARAHDAGIRIIVDIVPNHTSDLHEWFQEALASPPGSAARNRYIFREGGGDDGSIAPSDWRSHFGGSAWERLPDGQWYLHLFAREQPDLNWDNPEVREDFHRTLRFWADRGVDGFRVDVAHALTKDFSEPLRSQSTLDKALPLDGSDPLYDRDAVHEIFEGWRDVFNEYDPPRTAVAEAWVPAERRTLYARPTELGQAFNFDLLTAPWDAAGFRATIEKNLAEAAASGASSTWVLSNHDVIRHPSRYGLPAGTDTDEWLMSGGHDPELDFEKGLRRARAGTLLMLALPGSAYIYQGEELGLFEVADLPADALQDPVWERTGRTRKGRDGSRVPIPWETSAPAFGFGTAPAWLPQPDAFRALAASVQEGVAGSTLELYRSALHWRRLLRVGESLTWDDVDGSVGGSGVGGSSVGGSGVGGSGVGGCGVVAFHRHAGWRVVTNFGTEPVSLPPGTVLISSSPLPGDGKLPGETTVWLR